MRMKTPKQKMILMVYVPETILTTENESLQNSLPAPPKFDERKEWEGKFLTKV
jgi:hypothetical protein